MVQKVTKWEAIDGSIHDTEKEANMQDKVIEFRVALQSLNGTVWGREDFPLMARELVLAGFRLERPPKVCSEN